MKKNIVTEFYKNALYWIVWVTFLAGIVICGSMIRDNYIASQIAESSRLRYAVFVQCSARVMMAISVLLTDYLLEIRRPFASVKGDFYCTHVLTLLQNAVQNIVNANSASGVI